MKTISKLLAVTSLLTIVSYTLMAQSNTDFSITIEGEVLKPMKLSVKDLEKFPITEVKAQDRDGKEHTFKGTLLSVVLDSAGVTLGKQLKGENLAKYVLIKAVDGYEVIFSLPEIDPEFTAQTVLLATSVDGSSLPKGEGPFRIVAPQDKKHARWIREIVSINVKFSND